VLHHQLYHSLTRYRYGICLYTLHHVHDSSCERRFFELLPELKKYEKHFFLTDDCVPIEGRAMTELVQDVFATFVPMSPEQVRYHCREVHVQVSDIFA